MLALAAIVVTACQSVAPSPSAAGATQGPGATATPGGPVGTPGEGGILRGARRAPAGERPVEPYAAPSSTTPPDYKQYTLKRDPPAAFCDGSPITSADVAF